MTETLLIVGGSSGIGAATLDPTLRGHRVIQASRHPDLARVAPEVTSLEWDACGGEFPAQSLPDFLDGLVYCQGGIRLKPFARLSAAELREDLTRLRLFACSRDHFGPVLLRPGPRGRGTGSPVSRGSAGS